MKKYMLLGTLLYNMHYVVMMAAPKKHLTVDDMLLNAANNANYERVIQALQNGANPNIKDCFNRRPLHIAATTGCIKTIELLLRYPRIKINCQDIWGCTPLHDATEKRNKAIIDALITQGALASIKNIEGKTPAESIEADSVKNEIIKKILQETADWEIEEKLVTSDQIFKAINNKIDLCKARKTINTSSKKEATLQDFKGWQSQQIKFLKNNQVHYCITTWHPSKSWCMIQRYTEKGEIIYENAREFDLSTGLLLRELGPLTQKDRNIADYAPITQEFDLTKEYH